MQDKKRMFDNFIMRFPFIAEKVVEYWESSDYGITVRLEGGDIFLYDDVDGSIRKLPKNSNVMTEDECRNEFGNRLRRLLAVKTISQDELCDRVGIHPVMLSRYMNGKTTPSFYIVDKIAKVLNCSIDEFRYI